MKSLKEFLSEMNKDGTVSPNETEEFHAEMKAHVAKIHKMMDQLKEISYKHGGGFRGPGYHARAMKAVKEHSSFWR